LHGFIAIEQGWHIKKKKGKQEKGTLANQNRSLLLMGSA
jgi:hypothetical protein